MQLPPFLTQGSLGEIRVTGHRIDLYHLIYYHNSGQSAAQLHEQFPTLSVELLEEVLAFYQSHRVEVDDYVRRYQEEADRQYANGKRIDWAELKRRWDARKQSNAG